MPDQVYIEGQGLVDLTSEEQTAFDARRASDAEWRTEDLRAERNAKLAATDWWASSDLSMTEAQTAYRQALRDITNTASSLNDVVWPVKP
jgi:hypothetical protein